MKVSKLNATLKEACIERGFEPDDEISARQAVCEWCGWELGDPAWGETILDLYAAAKRAEDRS